MGGHEPSDCLDEAFQLALLRALSVNFDGYINCIDRERRVLYLNRTVTRDLQEILGKRIEEFMTPEYRDVAVAATERAFTTGEPQRVEFTVLLATGESRYQLSSFIPFRLPNGEQVALQLTTDVTESRRMAAELEQSLEFRRRVVEHLPDYVSMMDREHRFVWMNRFDPPYTPADIIGKTLRDFATEEAWEAAHRAIDKAFARGTVEQYEVQGPTASGGVAWYAVRVVPIDAGGSIQNVLLITTDVTERRRAEQALRDKEALLHRAQRLESVGQLAGGIAHDFNNLLQVIEGNLSFVKDCLKYGEDPSDDLEQALRATERAGELTAHLLAIGRRSQLVPKRVALGALVEDSLRMLRRLIPENIKLSIDVAPAPLLVNLDPPQFEQVLMNLCVNARDAMPRGGTLLIRVRADGEQHVALEVQDSGTGIPPENLARIFEPFFTTKGSGSGLGLAVAMGIVEAHGGELRAESDGQHGTRMWVRLPRAAGGVELAAPAPEATPPGSGLVLVAEDEELVRSQLKRLLSRAGYTVLMAENGARAVELFRERQSEIDLVLLDVVMPELDGWQAFSQMQALKPTLKALFTTGYAASVLPADFNAHGARLISKPYKRQQLLAQIRELLNQQAPG